MQIARALGFGRKAKLAENRGMKADNSRDYSRESLSHDAIFLTFLSSNPRQPCGLNRPLSYIGVLSRRRHGFDFRWDDSSDGHATGPAMEIWEGLSYFIYRLELGDGNVLSSFWIIFYRDQRNEKGKSNCKSVIFHLLLVRTRQFEPPTH